ncbi:MAG: hypothetical protein R2844_10380 [Caldilineales bacterium]
MKTSFFLLLIVVMLATTVEPAASFAQTVPPDPGLPGPYSVAQDDFTLQGLGATVFYPGTAGAVAEGGPFPGLVLGHGFARSRAQHANNGVFLASHGYVVVTLNFPNPLSPDFDAWATQISAALDWMEAQNSDPLSLFFDQIDTDRFGVLGHSAGGMATWVAASRDSRIKATMPLDPVPGGGFDLTTLGAAVTNPSGWTGAPGSSCNASASYNQFYPLVQASHKAQYIVADATHCDFEDPTNILCTAVCGSASEARRQIWRRYTVSWLNYYLKGDTDYYYYIIGQGLVDDLASGRLTNTTALNTRPRDASASAAPNGGAATLTWLPYPVTPIAGYDVYRRLVPEPAPVLIASLSVTDVFTDTGLPAGQYEYALLSRDTAGNPHQPIALPVLDVSCYQFDVAPDSCDGVVDTLDIQAVALAWQSIPGQPAYDPRYDVDGDQVITVVDVQTFAAQWGWPSLAQQP